MKKSFSALALATGLSLTGCTTILNNLPGVYSLDIQQGNVINQEMVDQLRPNMTKRQVLYIMGSPMLVDVFHQNRWDFLYSEQPGGGPRVQKRLSLYFDGDHLIGVQGDFKPSTLPVIAEPKETTLEIPERDLEKTLWEKIASLFSDEPVVKKSVTTGDPDTAKQPEKEFEEPF
ncbi:outer membrane protein assembly factor BamE [Methylomarinum sp. Ch1-1]|uniref:Outer membrane protein assembly factor BamE n=1 Tax=Methylomarinum roseum TaxID=3067653 RepID=A0AAU7NZW3_9GAMM|nr:outer membrane protein assembly factor BamE [Methylomarinum sp. Ch1-1]MDP4521357.1 outer membrane protein assembly factor BamE [Methylomarinum sp. Ch1-1]